MNEQTRANGLHRPVPDDGLGQRFRSKLENQRERMRTRRELRNSWPADGADASIQQAQNAFSAASPSKPILATIAIGLASAALAVGALFFWQSWSQRSDPPVDDLLPFLVDAPLPVEPLNPDQSEDINQTSELVQAPDMAQVPGAASPAVPNQQDPADQIIVHVSGAVVDAGVVELAPGSRVFEAVQAAGGAREAADLDRVNLAAPMADGERIHIPTIGEDTMPEVVEPDRPNSAAAAGSNGDSASDDVPLDINAVTASELEALPGIGPSIAQAIVATREARGPFLAVDELLEVPGIGVSKLEAIRDRVMVGPR